MAIFEEPDLSVKLAIQERLNIISSYLAFCITSSVLLIIYLHCLLGLYFNILSTVDIYSYKTGINNTFWSLDSNSSYDDESFSL